MKDWSKHQKQNSHDNGVQWGSALFADFTCVFFDGAVTKEIPINTKKGKKQEMSIFPRYCHFKKLTRIYRAPVLCMCSKYFIFGQLDQYNVTEAWGPIGPQLLVCSPLAWSSFWLFKQHEHEELGILVVGFCLTTLRIGCFQMENQWGPLGRARGPEGIVGGRCVIWFSFP